MPKTVAPPLRTTQQDGVLVFAITEPQLQRDVTAEALRQEMLRALAETKAKNVVIDFQHVEFITTIAFQPLLSLRRKVHEAGGHVVVCGLSPAIHEVFEVTRLIATQPGVLAAFDWSADVTTAVARLQG